MTVNLTVAALGAGIDFSNLTNTGSLTLALKGTAGDTGIYAGITGLTTFGTIDTTGAGRSVSFADSELSGTHAFTLQGTHSITVTGGQDGDNFSHITNSLTGPATLTLDLAGGLYTTSGISGLSIFTSVVLGAASTFLAADVSGSNPVAFTSGSNNYSVTINVTQTQAAAGINFSHLSNAGSGGLTLAVTGSGSYANMTGFGGNFTGINTEGSGANGAAIFNATQLSNALTFTGAHAYTVAVSDIASNVSSAQSGLEANIASIQSITLTDSSPQTLVLTVDGNSTHTTELAGILAKLNNTAGDTIELTGTAANLSAAAATLSGLSADYSSVVVSDATVSGTVAATLITDYGTKLSPVAISATATDVNTNQTVIVDNIAKVSHITLTDSANLNLVTNTTNYQHVETLLSELTKGSATVWVNGTITDLGTIYGSHGFASVSGYSNVSSVIAMVQPADTSLVSASFDSHISVLDVNGNTTKITAAQLISLAGNGVTIKNATGSGTLTIVGVDDSITSSVLAHINNSSLHVIGEITSNTTLVNTNSLLSTLNEIDVDAGKVLNVAASVLDGKTLSLDGLGLSVGYVNITMNVADTLNSYNLSGITQLDTTKVSVQLAVDVSGGDVNLTSMTMPRISAITTSNTTTTTHNVILTASVLATAATNYFNQSGSNLSLYAAPFSTITVNLSGGADLSHVSVAGGTVALGVDANNGVSDGNGHSIVDLRSTSLGIFTGLTVSNSSSTSYAEFNSSNLAGKTFAIQGYAVIIMNGNSDLSGVSGSNTLIQIDNAVDTSFTSATTFASGQTIQLNDNVTTATLQASSLDGKTITLNNAGAGLLHLAISSAANLSGLSGTLIANTILDVANSSNLTGASMNFGSIGFISYASGSDSATFNASTLSGKTIAFNGGSAGTSIIRFDAGSDLSHITLDDSGHTILQIKTGTDTTNPATLLTAGKTDFFGHSNITIEGVNSSYVVSGSASYTLAESAVDGRTITFDYGTVHLKVTSGGAVNFSHFAFSDSATVQIDISSNISLAGSSLFGGNADLQINAGSNTVTLNEDDIDKLSHSSKTLEVNGTGSNNGSLVLRANASGPVDISNVTAGSITLQVTGNYLFSSVGSNFTGLTAIIVDGAYNATFYGGNLSGKTVAITGTAVIKLDGINDVGDRTANLSGITGSNTTIELYNSYNYSSVQFASGQTITADAATTSTLSGANLDGKTITIGGSGVVNIALTDAADLSGITANDSNVQISIASSTPGADSAYWKLNSSIQKIALSSSAIAYFDASTLSGKSITFSGTGTEVINYSSSANLTNIIGNTATNILALDFTTAGASGTQILSPTLLSSSFFANGLTLQDNAPRSDIVSMSAASVSGKAIALSELGSGTLQALLTVSGNGAINLGSFVAGSNTSVVIDASSGNRNLEGSTFFNDSGSLIHVNIYASGYTVTLNDADFDRSTTHGSDSITVSNGNALVRVTNTSPGVVDLRNLTVSSGSLGLDVDTSSTGANGNVSFGAGSHFNTVNQITVDGSYTASFLFADLGTNVFSGTGSVNIRVTGDATSETDTIYTPYDFSHLTTSGFSGKLGLEVYSGTNNFFTPIELNSINPGNSHYDGTIFNKFTQVTVDSGAEAHFASGFVTGKTILFSAIDANTAHIDLGYSVNAITGAVTQAISPATSTVNLSGITGTGLEINVDHNVTVSSSSNLGSTIEDYNIGSSKTLTLGVNTLAISGTHALNISGGGTLLINDTLGSIDSTDFAYAVNSVNSVSGSQFEVDFNNGGSFDGTLGQITTLKIKTGTTLTLDDAGDSSTPQLYGSHVSLIEGSSATTAAILRINLTGGDTSLLSQITGGDASHLLNVNIYSSGGGDDIHGIIGAGTSNDYIYTDPTQSVAGGTSDTIENFREGYTGAGSTKGYDFIDLSSLNITSAGGSGGDSGLGVGTVFSDTPALLTTGDAASSGGTGFQEYFDTGNHTLYIDTSKTGTYDMQIVLTGVSTLTVHDLHL